MTRIPKGEVTSNHRGSKGHGLNQLVVSCNTLSLPREIYKRRKSTPIMFAGVSEKRFSISVFLCAYLPKESIQPKNHTPKITPGVFGMFLEVSCFV